MERDVMITLRLTRAEADALKACAAFVGLTVSDWLRQLIRKHHKKIAKTKTLTA